MKLSCSFFSIGIRWGGRILPRLELSLSRNFMTTVLMLILMLWIVFPAVAQDATPTADIIVPTAPPDGVPVVAPIGTVDTTIVFALMAVFGIIMLGREAAVTYLSKRLGDSVPADKVQEIFDSAQKWAWQQAQMAAARTPQTWDDTLVNAGAAVLGYNPSVGTPVRTPLPPRTAPPAPPVPIPPTLHTNEVVVQPVPLRTALNGDYDLRRTTFTELIRDQKRVAVPGGYSYYAVTGDTAVHTDAFYDAGEGFKMMLDSRGKLNEHGKAAHYGYESLTALELYAGVRYTIAPHFDAKISGGTVNIRAALLDGDSVLFDFPPQRIEPGTYADKSVVFVFQLTAKVQKSVFNLRLRVYVETDYATLRDDSYIRWRTLPLEAQAPDYGNDAVIRY